MISAGDQQVRFGFEFFGMQKSQGNNPNAYIGIPFKWQDIKIF